MSGNNTKIHSSAAKIAAPVKNGVKARLRSMLASRRYGMWLVAAISCCAALVVVGVTMRFSMDAAAMNTPVLVLDCHFAGNAAHTHVDACYDADGNLVCPLDERPLHTHTAACYDADGTLTCGLEELTKEHVHGAGCFIVAPVSDGETPQEPVMSFQQQAGDLLVAAFAPQGAFPDGTTMTVTPIDAEQVAPAVARAIDGEVDKFTAVDITFRNAQGREIQPTAPIEISMFDTGARCIGQPVVLHMDEDGNATVVAQSPSASANDEVSFAASKFSVYIMAVKKLQQTLTASDGRTYDISVTYTEEAGIPDDAELVVSEVTENDSNFSQVFNRAKDTATSQYDGATVTSARFFDISLMKDGVKLEPLAPVEVNIVLANGIDATEATSVVHFTNSRKVELVDADVTSADTEAETGADITFTTESFSIFGVIEMKIEKDVLASDGNNYHITVTYGPSAGVPSNATLDVTEVLPDSEDSSYDAYLAQIGDALGWSGDSPAYARLFDIKIVDATGAKVEIAAPVDVRIELTDPDDMPTSPQEAQVVHFADGATAPDVIQNVDVEDGAAAYSFAADSFSVYAIVEGPVPTTDYGWQKITSVEELASLGSQGVYMRHRSGYYFTNETQVISGTRTGITKTSKATTPDQAPNAVLYYFEPVADSTNKFKVYCYAEDGTTKQYIKQSNNSLSFTDEAGATAFTIGAHSSGGNNFYAQGSGTYCWNMQGGDSGKTFAAFGGLADGNAAMQFEYFIAMEYDPYGLDGKSYGIAYHNESAAAAALMAETKDAKHLVATEMLMRPDVLDNEGILLVAEDTDISWWTFECDTENHYYVSTVVDGATKYLTLTGNALTLEDAKSENALITITHGTDTNSGKYRFSVGEYAIEPNLNGNDVSKGFWGIKSTGDTTYLNLVEESVLTDDDFKLYTAKKVSVSDTTNVYDGQQVVIYTRVWNDTTKRYEFYAVDSDGSLVRCYDTGDNIEWIGSQVNTALWDFTEYLNSEGEVSYYYELQNTQYGTYIAPQVTGGQVLSNSTIGINLNGRRYGESYTTIIAWDDDNYAYAGLKVEDGHVVACPLSEADDFYFAVMNPVDTGDKLSEVETIDSSAYGITMKIIDFNNDIRNRDGNPVSSPNGRDVVQTEFFGYDSDTVGLLSTDLGEDGYPTIATTLGSRNGDPLSDLFTDMTDVNHLFLKSIYNESGYFEYDSTSNFAHLNDDGTFTVYDQLGAITGNNATKNTRTHGQFMPYDQIEEGKYAYNKGVLVTNQTDVSGNDLPDTDPRKGEKLYDLGKDTAVDYFFGMEMEASFTQTKSGLDAWGHDIIFEFSGDDDFWFYVDGELVLDLGGVHRAMAGSVNFRTGEVVYNKHGNGGPGGTERTTLYEIFKANYEARGLSKAEIDARLADIFIQNDEGNYVFKDYSNHTMRMFYMERGAGASNLHMRFNLAAVKPGTFILSKQLSGTESASNDLIEFPYQVWYKSKTDSQFHLLGVKDGEAEGVHYNGTSAQVTHKESFKPAGGTEAYEHVFMLKPGQSAEVTLPEDAISYYVVECGVNPAVYDEVTANGTELGGTTSRNAGRKDYATSEDTLANRSELTYDNHVSPGAMRTLDITKRLYDSDGSTPLSYEDDQTEFNFRLYLGNENADAKDLPAASLYAYYVKDGDGNYCRWNAAQKRFVSLGITTYEGLSAYLDTLTSAEKESIIFSTSMNGAISKIPADHTVEVRGLIVGTQYKVEERTTEIPKGYTRRLSDGYTRMDGGEEKFETDWYSDTIEADESPEVEVRNQKGWGLTVNKVWSDKDFMETHDPIYFAVYLKGDDGSLTLVNNTVRQLPTTKSEVYYFFGELENKNAFAEYTVREVTVVGGSVDQDGVVTGYTSVTPIDDNGTLTIGGKPAGGKYREGYTYTVTYQPGEQTTQNENVRTDAVTNTRPGIELFKTDWDGSPLAGAKFTLVDATGANVAAASYTSDSEGKITTAYLSSGTYTLTETEAPRGFVVLDEPMTITVERDAGGTTTVTVSGVDSTFYDVTYDNPAMAATITVKDRPNSFQVRKVDGSDEPIEGAHFELYRQVTDATGNKRKDYLPKPGYEDLVSDANGILAEVTMNLGPGTYYLTETQATEGFDLLEDDVCFTIGTDGTVVVEDPHASWLSKSTIDDVVSYKLAIPNGKMNKVSFKKVDVANIDHPLAGSEFDLYPVVGEERAEEPLWSGLTSGEDGMLADDGDNTVFELPIGTYHLVETKAPAGYNLKAGPVVINVTADGVTYDEGTTLSSSGSGLERGKETLVYLLKVSNTSGYELPHTGGAGTTAYTMFGAVAMGASLVLFLRRRLHISW